MHEWSVNKQTTHDYRRNGKLLAYVVPYGNAWAAVILRVGKIKSFTRLDDAKLHAETIIALEGL